MKWASLLACLPLACSPQAKEAAADASYAAEHLKCVDDHATKEEIDACRAAVRLRWHVKLDAGKDAQ